MLPFIEFIPTVRGLLRAAFKLVSAVAVKVRAFSFLFLLPSDMTVDVTA